MLTALGQYRGLMGPRMGDSDGDTASTVEELFGGSQQALDQHGPTSLLADPGDRHRAMGSWPEVGGDDAEPLDASLQLVPPAQQAGIDTCLVVVPGGQHVRSCSVAFRTS